MTEHLNGEHNQFQSVVHVMVSEYMHTTYPNACLPYFVDLVLVFLKLNSNMLNLVDTVLVMKDI